MTQPPSNPPAGKMSDAEIQERITCAYHRMVVPGASLEFRRAAWDEAIMLINERVKRQAEMFWAQS